MSVISQSYRNLIASRNSLIIIIIIIIIIIAESALTDPYWVQPDPSQSLRHLRSRAVT